MNTIDLSKIKIRETPVKEIKVNFEGTEKTASIRGLTDGERASFISVGSENENPFRIRNMYVLLLACGLDISEKVAGVLYDHCHAEAVRVGDEIFNLSQDFIEAQNKEQSEAEKNSNGETAQA